MVNLLSFAPVVLSAVTVLAHPNGVHHVNAHHHQNIARWAAANVSLAVLEKRAFTGDATWFEVGLGSCGGHNSGNEFVVALNRPRYAGGSHCHETVHICANDRCTNAQIVDMCPPCSPGSLDMSKSLFQFFNDLDVGRFTITWTFGSGPPPPKPKPKPKPKPTPEHEHTHTHHRPDPTSTKDKVDDKPTEKSEPSKSDSDPAPSPTPSDKDKNDDDKKGGNLDLLTLDMAEIGRLLVFAGQGS